MQGKERVNWSKSIKLLFAVNLILIMLPIFLRYLRKMPVILEENIYPIYGINLIAISIILSCLNFLLLKSLLDKLGSKEKENFFILLLYTLSPFTISSAILSLKENVSLTLLILTIIFFLNSKTRILSVISSLVLSTFGITHAFFAPIIMFNCMKLKFFKSKLFYVSLAGSLLVIVLLHYPSITEVKLVEEESRLVYFFSDFGGETGISVFAFILAIIGIVQLLKYKTRHYSLYILSLFFLISAFFFHETIQYAHLAVIFFAGISFKNFYDQEWELKNLKNSLLLVIFCGLLFSTIAKVSVLVDAQPTNDLVEGFSWLEKNTATNSIIFSYFKNSNWVEQFSKRKTFINQKRYDKKILEQKLKDYHMILNSLDLRVTKELLQKNKIEYVVITRNMIEGAVWDKSERGLHYLLGSKENFQKVYENEEVGIWKVMLS